MLLVMMCGMNVSFDDERRRTQIMQELKTSRRRIFVVVVVVVKRMPRCTSVFDDFVGVVAISAELRNVQLLFLLWGW